jgi:AcrR family transcriptional regulator
MVTNASAPEITRRHRRRSETKGRIFDAALRLFAEKGYVNTTVEEITAAADVAKGTFFNYFPSKEHVLFALSERQEQVVRRAGAAAKDAMTVKPILLELALAIAAGPGRSQLMLRSLLGTAFLNEPMVRRLSDVLAIAREEIAKIMRRGQEIGELRSDVSAENLALGMQSMIFGTNAIWSLCKDKDLSRSMKNSVELFWRGISNPTEPQVSNGRSDDEG